MISHSKPDITKKDLTAVRNALISGSISEGKKAGLFADAIVNYVGCRHSVVTNSGTSALILALKALNIVSGDEVIMPTYVCRSVLDAVNFVGAKPIFCDISKDYNLTVKDVASRISRNTKAIIAVYIFGISADIMGLLKLKVPVIEDCCQSFGLKMGNKMAGSYGAFGVFSFNATKCFSTGEGGALVTNDPTLFKRVKNISPEIFRMSDLQASLGISQLSRYEQMLSRRMHIAEAYFRSLAGVKVGLPYHIQNKSIFFRFPLLTESNNFRGLQKEFLNSNVHVRKGVDTLLHRLIGLPDKKFPVAVEMFNKTICLPIYPALTAIEKNIIIGAAKKVFGYVKD